MQAVQAAGPLPSVAGMQTTGNAAHHSMQVISVEGKGGTDTAAAFVFNCAWSDAQGKALWAQAGQAKPYTYLNMQNKKDQPHVRVAKMLMLQGDFTRNASVPGQLVVQGHLSGTQAVYLCLQLLPCYQSPALPRTLLRRWEAAGLIARSGGGWVACREGLHRFALVIRAQPKQRCSWQLSQLSQVKFAQLFYDNAWLRRGLGLLGLRLREEGDADGAVVCSMGGHQFVYTELGASLWHDTMHAVFGSLEAACSLEVHWTTQPPKQAQAEQEPDDLAPAAWQLRRVDMAAGQPQQGA